MATPNIVPRADSEGGIGTSSKYWASAYIDLIYVGAGKVGRDSDNLLDFSTDNSIIFKTNNSNRLRLDQSQFYPVSNDGLSLGTATTAFSDLFLATGAVINFNNGDVTLTHSSGALRLADSDSLGFGTGADLKIDHDGSHSYIYNSTGNLEITNYADDSDIIFKSDDGSGGVATYLTLDGGAGHMIASKELNFADGVKASFGAGAGDLKIYSDGTDSYFQQTSGDMYFYQSADDKDISFQSDDGSGGVAEYFRLDGGDGQINVSKNIKFYDDVQAWFGNGNDLRIYHNATNSEIGNYTGSLTIFNHTDDGDINFQADNGAGSITTYFYLDGSSATHDGSATTSLYTNWPDKSRISMGTSHDLQIQHDGTDSAIANYVGDLYITNSADDKDIIFKSDDGSGGTTTYFYLDGSLSTPYTRFPDSSILAFGTDADLAINHNGTNSLIENYVGNLEIINNTDDGDIIFKSDDGSGGVETYFFLDGSASSGSPYTIFPDNSFLAIGSGGSDFRLYHDGSNTYMNNGTGNLYILNNTDDGDIIFQSDDGSGGTAEYFRLDGGDSITRFTRQARFNDSIIASFGTSGDLTIQHDSNNSYINANGTGDLYIKQMTADKDIRFLSDDGSGSEAEYFRLDGGASSSGALHTIWPDDSRVVFGSDSDAYIRHSGSDLLMSNATGTMAFYQQTDDGDMKFYCDDGSGGNTAYLTLEGANVRTKIHKDLNIEDNVQLQIGNSQDLKLYHNGSHSFIDSIGVGNLYITQSIDDADIILSSDDGSGGTTAYITIDGSATQTKFDKNARFNDSVRAEFGSSGDLVIQHDGSDSKIENATGDLKIRNFSDDKDIIFENDNGAGGSTTYFFLDGSAAAHDGSATTHLFTTWVDNSRIAVGTGRDFQITHTGTDTYQSNNTGDLIIQNNTTDKDIVLKSDDGSGSTTTYLQLDGSDVSTKILTQKVIMSNLPTSDPSNAGQLWNDSGTLKISAG